MPKKKGGSEIMLARGRLKGVLQDLVTPSDSEMIDEYENMSNLPLRGRPPKRIKTEGVDQSGPVHESFVMKLFDRSLDLAKYKENTALYPVCRAWMANSPKWNCSSETIVEENNPELRESSFDVYEKMLNGKIKKLTAMPPPKFSEIYKIPSINTRKIKEEIFDSDQENQHQYSKENLLTEHKSNWKKIRNEWIEHMKKYQERFEMNFELLNSVKEI